MASAPPNQETTFEPITDNIRARWLHNKQIIVYDVFADVDSDFVVHSLYDHIDAVVQGWNISKPFLTLFHHHDIMPLWSPIQNQRLNHTKELAKQHFSGGRAAVILPRNPLTFIIRVVLRTIRVGQIEIREFSSYDKALAWLEEMLD
jgi:hypothetical protein